MRLSLMNGSKTTMTNVDLLTAAFIFYLRSGADAKEATREGANGPIEFRSPSEADLHTIMHKTPMAIWRGVQPTAEAFVQRIAESEPRDLMTVVRDVGGLIEKGQETLAKFARPPMTGAEIDRELQKSKQRRGGAR